MKEGIHPKYQIAQVECACGFKFTTKSTQSLIKLDICSHCHPFFTGKQKLLDTAGRVERFQKRFAKTGGKMTERKPAKTKRVASKPHKSYGRVLSSAPRAAAAKPEKKK